MGKLLQFLKKIFEWFKSPAVRRAFEQAAELVPVVLPIVKQVAVMTPTRVDDELVELAERCGVPALAEAWTKLPGDERGVALFQAVVLLASQVLPGISGKIVSLAVQMAYTAWQTDKAAAKPEPAILIYNG